MIIYFFFSMSPGSPFVYAFCLFNILAIIRVLKRPYLMHSFLLTFHVRNAKQLSEILYFVTNAFAGSNMAYELSEENWKESNVIYEQTFIGVRKWAQGRIYSHTHSEIETHAHMHKHGSTCICIKDIFCRFLICKSIKNYSERTDVAENESISMVVWKS